jgi:hypothetical protein
MNSTSSNQSHGYVQHKGMNTVGGHTGRSASGPPTRACKPSQSKQVFSCTLVAKDLEYWLMEWAEQ